MVPSLGGFAGQLKTYIELTTRTSPRGGVPSSTKAQDHLSPDGFAHPPPALGEAEMLLSALAPLLGSPLVCSKTGGRLLDAKYHRRASRSCGPTSWRPVAACSANSACLRPLTNHPKTQLSSGEWRATGVIGSDGGLGPPLAGSNYLESLLTSATRKQRGGLIDGESGALRHEISLARYERGGGCPSPSSDLTDVSLERPRCGKMAACRPARPFSSR